MSLPRRFDRDELLAAPPPAFALPMRVPFHHIDAAGMVFYARMFDWFHDAYAAFLVERGMPLHELLPAGRFVAPLVHAEADYLAPLRFGDPIEVGLVRAVASVDRLLLGFRVDSAAGTAAVGCTAHVSIDPATLARRPMPEALREAFLAIG